MENRKETQYDEAGGKQEGMGRDVSRLLPPLLARWELIQVTDTFAKQAKHFALHLVKAFNNVVNLTLHLHPDTMAILVVGVWDEIQRGDLEGRATMDEFFGGNVTALPERDPMTLKTRK